MKGHVHRRGKTYHYFFDGDPDPLTGKRRQVTKGGFGTEREAWAAGKPCPTTSRAGLAGHKISTRLYSTRCTPSCSRRAGSRQTPSTAAGAKHRKPPVSRPRRVALSREHARR